MKLCSLLRVPVLSSISYSSCEKKKMKMKKTMMMMTMMMISLSDDYSDVRSCILSNAMQYLLFGTEREGGNKTKRLEDMRRCNAMQCREEKRRGDFHCDYSFFLTIRICCFCKRCTHSAQSCLSCCLKKRFRFRFGKNKKGKLVSVSASRFL